MKKTILLAASAVIMALTLVSCKNDPIYLKGYYYEAKLSVFYGTKEDLNKVQTELNAVVGDNGSGVRSTLSSPVDEKMKSGCAAIQQKYAGKLNRVYFSFILQRITLDSNPNAAQQKTIDELALYEFGDALQHSYAFYDYTSNTKDALATLKTMKDNMPEEDYKACGQTLYGVETAFKNEFSKFNLSPYFVSDENDNAIKKLGDDFFAEYSAKKNAVEYKFIIYRTDLRSAEVTKLWEKTFPVNYTPAN